MPKPSLNLLKQKPEFFHIPGYGIISLDNIDEVEEYSNRFSCFSIKRKRGKGIRVDTENAPDSISRKEKENYVYKVWKDLMSILPIHYPDENLKPE